MTTLRRLLCLVLSLCAWAAVPATAQELFNSCAAHGGEAWDHSGMVRALEVMANFEIGSAVSA